jgi:hypothetical protein
MEADATSAEANTNENRNLLSISYLLIVKVCELAGRNMIDKIKPIPLAVCSL